MRFSFQRAFLSGRVVEGRPQHHVLDGERGDGGVVSLEHRRRDHEGFRVEQPGRQAHGYNVQIRVQYGNALELGLGVQIDQLQLLLLVLGRQGRKSIVFKTLLGIAVG